jgi:hypothetical protein
LFYAIRHPLIIAPIAAQRQALLTERLLRGHCASTRSTPSADRILGRIVASSTVCFLNSRGERQLNALCG